MFSMGQTVVTIRRLKVAEEERGRELFRLFFTPLSEEAWEQLNVDYETSLQPTKIVWRVEHHQRGLSFFRPVLREMCFWDDFETPEAALAEFDRCSEALTNPGLIGGLAGWAREIGASVRDCWRWVMFRFKRPYWASPSAREKRPSTTGIWIATQPSSVRCWRRSGPSVSVLPAMPCCSRQTRLSRSSGTASNRRTRTLCWAVQSRPGGAIPSFRAP